MNVDHFKKEAEEINVYLMREFFTSVEIVDKYEHLKRELYSINLRLWRAEDEVRLIPEIVTGVVVLTAERRANVNRLAQLCKAIARLNDERARLVKAMNALYGPTTEEKIYVQSSST